MLLEWVVIAASIAIVFFIFLLPRRRCPSCRATDKFELKGKVPTSNVAVEREQSLWVLFLGPFFVIGWSVIVMKLDLPLSFEVKFFGVGLALPFFLFFLYVFSRPVSACRVCGYVRKSKAPPPPDKA